MLDFCVVNGVRVAVVRWAAAVRQARQISVDARPDFLTGQESTEPGAVPRVGGCLGGDSAGTKEQGGNGG
jgi:hypothetical protein